MYNKTVFLVIRFFAGSYAFIYSFYVSLDSKIEYQTKSLHIVLEGHIKASMNKNRLSGGTTRRTIKAFFNCHEALFISRGHHAPHRQTRSRSSLVAHTHATIRDHLQTNAERIYDREIQLAAWAMKEVEGGRGYWLWEGAPCAHGRLRVCDCPRRGYGSSPNASTIES